MQSQIIMLCWWFNAEMIEMLIKKLAYQTISENTLSINLDTKILKKDYIFDFLFHIHQQRKKRKLRQNTSLNGCAF